MSNSNLTSPILVTSGDPNGIGSITLMQSWHELKSDPSMCFVALNSVDYLKEMNEKFNLEINIYPIKSLEEAKQVFHLGLPVLDIPYQLSFNKTKLALDSLELATNLILKKKSNALVTLPINKYLCSQSGFNFIGHTEYLANKFNVTTPIMMMATPYNSLRVVPITMHLSLLDSIRILSLKKIVSSVTLLNLELTKVFKIISPKILLLGLNPHAGENGLMGAEEIEIINPAIRYLKQKGINVVGPASADTAFTDINIIKYDVICGMYHDQVLTPFKTLLFNQGVNVTLGLPFIRTSPNHGTAFELMSPCNKSQINHQSTKASIILAKKLSNI